MTRDDPVALPDGGVIEYHCPDCGPVTDVRVEQGARRCSECGKAVRTLATDGGVVPDGVDAAELRRRINAPSSTPPDQLERCPECGYASVTPIVGVHGAEHDYRCNNDECLARVDEEDLLVGGDDQ